MKYKVNINSHEARPQVCRIIRDVNTSAGNFHRFSIQPHQGAKYLGVISNTTLA